MVVEKSTTFFIPLNYDILMFGNRSKYEELEYENNQNSGPDSSLCEKR